MLQDPHSAYFCIKFFPELSRTTPEAHPTPWALQGSVQSKRPTVPSPGGARQHPGHWDHQQPHINPELLPRGGCGGRGTCPKVGTR